MMNHDNVYQVAFTTTWVIGTAPTICQVIALEKALNATGPLGISFPKDLQLNLGDLQSQFTPVKDPGYWLEQFNKTGKKASKSKLAWEALRVDEAPSLRAAIKAGRSPLMQWLAAVDRDSSTTLVAGNPSLTLQAARAYVEHVCSLALEELQDREIMGIYGGRELAGEDGVDYVDAAQYLAKQRWPRMFPSKRSSVAKRHMWWFRRFANGPLNWELQELERFRVDPSCQAIAVRYAPGYREWYQAHPDHPMRQIQAQEAAQRAREEAAQQAAWQELSLNPPRK